MGENLSKMWDLAQFAINSSSNSFLEIAMAYSIVLLVDPDKDARKNLEKVLEPQFKLVSVKNSTAASKAIKRNNVVLIVSETDLGPKSAPFEFLEQLKSDANTAAIPIIAVSENDEPQRRIQSLSIGVAHHLRKPVDAGVLLTLANATIKSNQRTVMAPKIELGENAAQCPGPGTDVVLPRGVPNIKQSCRPFRRRSLRRGQRSRPDRPLAKEREIPEDRGCERLT